MRRSEILGAVKFAISRVYGVSFFAITEQTSIEGLFEKPCEMVLDLEEVFAVNILDQDEDFSTVGKLVDYIQEALDDKFKWALS